MSNLFENVYNPDVLACIANLSNDEVFTPPEIANAMLDMLPQELFEDPNTTFLDPACKSGVFLREIAKRLIAGLEPIYPDLQERINHIMQKQLYGIAITELTSLLSRRSLYCSKYPSSKYSISKFDSIQGNIRFKQIRHVWEGNNCKFCGASKKIYDRDVILEQHAYEFIHIENLEDIVDMKFDVIIGNPPYQLSDGGSNASAMPLYNKFVEQSKRLNPKYISMIIPSRWFAGGRALTKFRSEMLNDKRIKCLVDYQQSKDCFPGVDIAGGVCYFLWDRDYSGDCNVINMIDNIPYSEVRSLNRYPIFVRNNIGNKIVEKVLSNAKFRSINTEMANYNPFLIRSYEYGKQNPFENCLKMLSSKGFSYVDRTIVAKNIELINKYKVISSKVTAEHAGEADKSGRYRILSSLQILQPMEICTESYVILNSFETSEEAECFMKYLQTKFIRFLILQAATSINLTQDTFMFAPINNYYDSCCTDEKLYEYYGLNIQEIEYIEKTIKPMND